MNNRHTHTPPIKKGKIKGYNTIILFAIKRQTRLLDIHFVPLPKAEQKKLQENGGGFYPQEQNNAYQRNLLSSISSMLSKDIKNALNTNS